MKTTLLLCFFMACFMASYAQQGPSVKVAGNCAVANTCADCGSPKAVFGKGDSLTAYFRRHIDSNSLETIEGIVSMKIYVDANGKVCCYAINNRSNASTEYITSLKLDKIINNMPLWKPAMVNKKPVNVALALRLYINMNEETIRVGYDRANVRYVQKAKKKPVKAKKPVKTARKSA